MTSGGPIAKVPWLPSHPQPGQTTERCPVCGAMTLVPWTLHRDVRRMSVTRTWVCLECQRTEERPEGA